jgi:enoyl-CoA hydratase/carnithine racemase
LRLDAHVGILEFEAGTHNHLNLALMAAMADAIAEFEQNATCRAIVIAAGGPCFSAGADFGTSSAGASRDPSDFYAQALRLFNGRKPIVAAVHGAAIGAGLGLALAADFRVGCAEARFSANFNRLGIHPGFGLSVTLPRVVGAQQAALLFYTGRRIGGQEAHRIGMIDAMVPPADVRPRAIALATEIAESAPEAVESTRFTLRSALAEVVAQANRREIEIQREQFASADFREGVAAMAARRLPEFTRC